MLHPTINRIWKHNVLSYWPSLMKNDKTIEKYSKHINQRWDLFFQARFVTIQKYLYKNPYSKANCQKKHGLSKFGCDKNGIYTCDGCGEHIKAYTYIYGCRTCDYDLCEPCYQKKSTGTRYIMIIKNAFYLLTTKSFQICCNLFFLNFVLCLFSLFKLE